MRTIKSSQKTACLNKTRQMAAITFIYSDDHDNILPHRTNGPGRGSAFAGGFHNDRPVNGHHWAKGFINNYHEGVNFDQFEPIEFYVCPSNESGGKSWRPSFAPKWRITDYALWPGLHQMTRWASVKKPPANINDADSNTPLIGDSLFRFNLRTNLNWWVSSHTISGPGINSYAQPNEGSQAYDPEGGNQVFYDGAGGWFDFYDFEVAADMRGWGSPLGAQFWAK